MRLLHMAEALAQAGRMHYAVEQATPGTQVPAALRPSPQQSQRVRPTDIAACRAVPPSAVTVVHVPVNAASQRHL